MVPSTIRKAIGTVKDQTSIGLAKVSSNLAPELEVAIVKATSHDDGPVDERYIREIINFTSYSRGYVIACVAAVSRRLCKTRDWIVALKVLMLVHRLIAEGVPAVQQELMYCTRHGTRLLNMSDFRDEAHSSSWDHSAFVRTYALYLDQQLECILQGHKNEAAASSAWTASSGSFNSHLDQMRWISPVQHHFSDYGVPDSSGSANNGWNANSSQPGCKREEMRSVTPLRDMTPDKVLGWMHQLQQLFERFLGCRPTGLAKDSRLILVALYPIVRDSFQLYAAICEILAVLLDRFFDMDYADCVKSFEAYAIAAKQIDELAAFYAWCKDTGVARSSEYPEVQRITDKLLETLEEFMRDRAKQPKSPPRRCEEPASAVQDQVLVQDMNSLKALPAPENFQEQKQQEEEKVVAQPRKAQNQPEVDLVDLRDDLVTADSQGNKLALALFFDGGTMKVANGTWETFPSAVASDEREVTSAWQTPATETGKADWELALVETASNLAKKKASMGGGFDHLLLNGMYDQGLVMRHASVQASGGSVSSVVLPGPGKTTPILALPSPDGTVHTIGQDPFAASLSIPPPSYVQMADTDRKQQLLFLEQQMWQQYSRDGMLGQTSLSKLNNVPSYANPAMAYGLPPSAGYYYPHISWMCCASIQGKAMLLHGMLYVDILEAEALPNPLGLPNSTSRFSRRKWLERRCSWMKRLASWFPKRLEDADLTAKLYATIDLEKARVGRTRVVAGEPSNPRWYESFRIYCAHMAEYVIFTLKSENPIGATLLGRAYLPTAAILAGDTIDTFLDVCNENRRPLPGGAAIRCRVRYASVEEEEEEWGGGIRTADFPGVPHTFFEQRRGCRVTLYHDAHVAGSFVPRIPLAGGEMYHPRRCWEDVFDAISDARHLIYIVGWSVYAEIRLVREGQRIGSGATLGELLKRKAGEGVTVLMLVWDDRTSVRELKKDGVMATHDEDTAGYFRGSAVKCVLCPRNPDVGESYVQGLEISTMFTHHQKTLIVDFAAGDPQDSNSPSGWKRARERQSPRRRIVSFLGGIDLCDGRYDTQEHSLFRTLAVSHRDDFHQPNFPGASLRKGGPREPWHDVHCRIEGQAAWDVLYNFEQRWKKQGSGEGLLFDLRVGGRRLVVPPNEDAKSSSDIDVWNVQIFRSIDGGAVYGFPESPKAAAAVGLVSGKNNVVDRSIQDAYIKAIRRAKHFIYIENQYFLGSSYGWKEEVDITVEDIGALHLVPKELSLKIASKIEAGERFAVYVVVPMWPEGVPESASVQAILDWQRRTMEMMFEDVAAALRARGVAGVDPRNYLNFFCLGNREAYKGVEYQPPEQPEADSDYGRAQQARRFMIYVHAKMMIVDDEYIIVGSANINQRSMDGGRDTEIAMGAYQPHHLSSMQPARGQIHGFRMSLWCEHLGFLDDSFLVPESLDCVLKLRQNAEKRWQFYLGNRLEGDLQGHLLSYPMSIGGDGKISALLGMETFPDTKARVLGSKSDYLPPILTT